MCPNISRLQKDIPPPPPTHADSHKREREGERDGKGDRLLSGFYYFLRSIAQKERIGLQYCGL